MKTRKGVNDKIIYKNKRDETVNYIISEYSKLVPKEYMSRHDWVGRVFHLKLIKNIKFDPTNKWYMHNPEFILKNGTEILL